MKAKFIVIAAVMMTAAAWGYTYNWTGAAGNDDFNDEANWEAEGSASSDPVYRFPGTGKVGSVVRLTDDFTATQIIFTNAADQATLTLDLGGHAITLFSTFSSRYCFYNRSPLILTNGAFSVQSPYPGAFWGLSDIDDLKVSFLDMRLECPTYYTSSYYKSLSRKSLYFKDSFVTNFPGQEHLRSNDEIVFDHCLYSQKPYRKHFGFGSGVTNATLRFSNGCTFDRYDYQFVFQAFDDAVGNRVIIDSGTELPFFGSSNRHTLSGTNSVFAISNAYVNGYASVGGCSNALIFSEAAYTNTDANSGMSVSGVGNKVLFDSVQDRISFYYLNLSNAKKTRDMCLELADNTVLSNKSFNFRPYTSDGTHLLLGTNCVLRLGYLMMYVDGTALSTNALFEVNEDSALLIDGQYVSSGFFGYNTRLVLNNGTFRYRGGGSYIVSWAGTTVELNGDKAKYIVDGYFNFGREVAAHPELYGVLKFRPGPTGYGGETPIQLKNVNSYLTLGTNTVFKFDLRDYLRDKRVRHHRIPLMTGDPSKWKSGFRPDLARLTETLEIKPKGWTKNEQVIYDNKKNAVCLDFDFNLGLMILVR